MIESFPSVGEDDVAKWAGICVSVFSLCQAITGIPWGRASDKYGRKPAILLGLISTMLCSLLWGFSKTLWMAVLARALQGAGNGNVGIIRTTVAEMVPYKELQPRAFSVMPLVWNVGSVFGPAIGGALANPRGVQPGEDTEGGGFFEVFPYALPNLVAAGLFLIGITFGFLYLEESMATVKNRPDYGLRVGKKITKALKHIFHPRRSGSETKPLLSRIDATQTHDDESQRYKKRVLSPPSYREVLNKQSILNLIVYALLALHSLGYDQLVPIFMHHPVQRNAGSSTNLNNNDPLKFAGGFGLDSARIGLIFTLYGVSGMLTQFLVFPPVARRFGVVRCLRVCACVFPVCYLVTPFTVLVPGTVARQVVCFAVLMVKGWCSIFAFPCSTILLTNSASSLRVLGTLNGMATSTSAIGRAAGPAIGGSIFTLGVRRGYMIAPWWLFSAIAVVAAVPVFWLVEGEGFGGEDGHEDGDDDTDEETEVLAAEGMETAVQPSGLPHRSATAQSVEDEAVEDEAGEDEDGFGQPGELLSRTSSASASSVAVESAPATPALSRRGSTVRRPSRRMSIPLGLGQQGMGRRYSSNLAQSFGNSGSFGGGSAL